MERFKTGLFSALLLLAGGCVWLGGQEEKAAAGACDWSGAIWISDGKPQPADDAACYGDDPAPLFRKTFRLAKKVRGAQLHIAGLGLYAACVNGESLNWELAPLWTPYGARVLYDTYDVTRSLRDGENVIAVELGNGWYNPLPLRMWGASI